MSDTDKCPDCGAELIRVRQAAISPLNAEQWASMKAGDLYCAACTGSRGASGHRYYWEWELPEYDAKDPANPVRRQFATANAALDTCHHDLKEIRQMMGCDGSDLEQLRAKWESVQAIIDKLPKDTEGNPIVEGATYWRRCGNGAYPVYAYLSPRNSPAKPYSWERCHPTEAAAKAAEQAQQSQQAGEPK